MKAFLRWLVNRALDTRFVWGALDRSVLKFARYADWRHGYSQKLAHDRDVEMRAIADMCKDLRVKHGPFKNMRYPVAQASGSPLFPKLLGSYEAEIAHLVEAICREPYQHIMVAGCAEGYYAVGLAMRIPGAHVTAYDVNPVAQRLCKEMAELNGVGDRVRVEALCDAAALASLEQSARALIVCDIDGYENQLFSKESAPRLSRHDILLEVHDLIDIETSSRMRERFTRTHTITVIDSIDDIQKALRYDYAELKGRSLAERRILLQEERPNIMQWFFLQPRSSNPSGTSA